MDAEEVTPASTVQPSQAIVPTASSKVIKSAWEWTKVKRKAVSLVLDGHTDKEIADKLGKHRNTILNWRHTPEFMTEVRQQMDQLATRTKLKRIRQTTLITDVLAGKLASALTEENLAKVSVYGREFHAMRGEERQDFGDNVKRVEGTFTVDGRHDVNVTGTVDFKDFLEAHVDVIDVEAVVVQPTLQDSVVLMTQQVLQNSDYLTELHEKDRESLKDKGER